MKILNTDAKREFEKVIVKALMSAWEQGKKQVTNPYEYTLTTDELSQEVWSFFESSLQQAYQKGREDKLSDLRRGVKRKAKITTAYFRRYGSYPEVETPMEIENVMKNFEDMGFNQALDDILNLLDKKGGEGK